MRKMGQAFLVIVLLWASFGSPTTTISVSANTPAYDWLVFSENFNDNEPYGWGTVSGSHLLQDGQYRIVNGEVLYQEGIFDNFQLTATVTLLSGADTSLIFRAQDGQHFYQTNISTDAVSGGGIRIYRNDGGTYTPIGSSIPYVPPLNVPIQLTLTAEGDQFTFTVEDGVLPPQTITASDSSYTDGYLGLKSYLAEALYDGIKVYEQAPPVEPEADNIQIGVFWPPTAAYANEEQFDYLQEAHVDLVMNVSTTDLQNIVTNKKMLRMAAERGMEVQVSDRRSANLAYATDAQVQAIVSEYEEFPALAGYHIKDEPWDYEFPGYAETYKKFIQYAPDSIPYVNLMGGSDFAGWVDLVGADKLKYLSYDAYPFQGATGYLGNYFPVLEQVRSVGLANEVKTARFLQSIGFNNAFRRPNTNEMRFDVYSSLTYGFKALYWFTWWTPTGRDEIFTDAIIDATGNKTDTYEPVKQLNEEIKNLGRTLVNLDSRLVYHNGTVPPGSLQLPSSLFWQPGQASDELVLSVFENAAGRVYVMVTNKSITDAKTFTFQLESGIQVVTEVSKATGDEVPTSYNPATGELSASFLPGEGRLYALPDGYELVVPQPNPGTNLTKGAAVTASSTWETPGWSAGYAADQFRHARADASMSWSSELLEQSNRTEWLQLELAYDYTFNTVDLYPRNDYGRVGSFFPRDFAIKVSSDGVNWQEVAARTDAGVEGDYGLRLAFASVNARYIRIESDGLGNDGTLYGMQLAEVEVYQNDGSLDSLTIPDAYRFAGANLALHKPVETSSSDGDEAAGWHHSKLTDGQPNSVPGSYAWTSSIAAGGANHTEWASVDLGAPQLLNTVLLYPRNDREWLGKYFPVEVNLLVSSDNTNWTEVASITGFSEPRDAATVLQFADVTARYVKVEGTALRPYGADGYLMQLAEMEVYHHASNRYHPFSIVPELSPPFTTDGRLVRWEAMLDQNGLEAPAYRIRVANDAAMQNVIVDEELSGRQWLLDTLIPGTYYVDVLGKTDTGAWIDNRRGTVQVTIGALPSEFTALTYEEMFDNDVSTSWTVVSGSAAVSAGQYALDNALTVLAQSSYEDFRYESVATFVAGADTSIVFRYVDEDNYYQSNISTDPVSGGVMALYKKENGVYTQIGTSIPYLPSTGTPIRQIVEADGDELVFMLDDGIQTLRIEAIDSTFSIGAIGLKTYLALVNYDDLQVFVRP